MRLVPALLASLVLLPTGAVAARAFAAQAQEPAQRPPIYDESADAARDLGRAAERARKEGSRVLVVWGANWCGWCAKLQQTFEGDQAVARELLYEYEVVHVDVGRFDKNLALASEKGADLKAHGLPYLTVLDEDGKVVANQDTGSLEEGSAHDPAKVLAFLKRHEAPRRDARALVDAARARAKAEEKTLFLHFGAPWCGWCKRLEAWMERPRVAELLAREFVTLKVDQDRMEHGAEMLAELRGGTDGGIPWFCVQDAEGKVLAHSGLGRENLGCPWSDEEVQRFRALLAGAARKLAPEDLDALAAELRAFRAELEDASKAKR